MQEEVTQKTIAFSIKSAKLTIQVLQAAARKFLETQNMWLATTSGGTIFTAM